MPRASIPDVLLTFAALALVAAPFAWMLWLAVFDPHAGVPVVGKTVPAEALVGWRP